MTQWDSEEFDIIDEIGSIEKFGSVYRIDNRGR
jgi:hypothetical protein